MHGKTTIKKKSNEYFYFRKADTFLTTGDTVYQKSYNALFIALCLTDKELWI
jgi:predicted phosphodiesterase